MPRFAANLSMMYTEHAFLDRFAAAARDGFARRRVPASRTSGRRRRSPARSPSTACSRCSSTRRPGDFAARRARHRLPARARGASSAAASHAPSTTRAALACPRVHVMAGLAPAGSRPRGAAATYLAQPRVGGARRRGAAGVDVLIEPINTRDIPGYFLNRQDEAHAIVAEVGAPQPQGADGPVPLPDRRGRRRHEAARATCRPAGSATCRSPACPTATSPTRGELNYAYLFDVIDALGYDGWIGCEYRPAAGTSSGLGWLRRAREAAVARRRG